MTEEDRRRRERKEAKTPADTLTSPPYLSSRLSSGKQCRPIYKPVASFCCTQPFLIPRGAHVLPLLPTVPCAYVFVAGSLCTNSEAERNKLKRSL